MNPDYTYLINIGWIRIRMDPELLPGYGSGSRKIQSWIRIRIRNKSFQIHNTSHNQPLWPSIMYPTTSDHTTNIPTIPDKFGSIPDKFVYQTRILPAKFGSYRLSVCRSLTRGQRAYIRRGGSRGGSTNILFILY